MNKYIENGVEKWRYAIKTIKEKKFIQWWKQPYDYNPDEEKNRMKDYNME